MMEQHQGKEEKKMSTQEERSNEYSGGKTESVTNADLCEEFTSNHLEGRRCPRCGAVILANADICENCGEWLLRGQCRFCYAPLEEGAMFCGQCGNPVDGIECPHCHTTSYFDFCKECGAPLTSQAIETIEAIKNSSDFVELEKLLGHKEDADTVEEAEQKELRELREYLEKLEGSHSRDNYPTLFPRGRMNSLEAKVCAIDQEERACHETSKGAARDAQRKVEQKKFANNQEARRYFGALKVLLPTIKRTPVGWLCNICHVLHPGGPQECCVAYGGGKWIYKEEQEITEVEI